MSGTSDNIPPYKFQPFVFEVLKKSQDRPMLPLMKFGNTMACNERHLFSHGSNQQTDDTDSMPELRKYSFDLNEWKIIPSKNLAKTARFTNLNSVIMSGNIIIICIPCSNQMYLGNLANEYEKGGMQFEKLTVSGDIPLSVFDQGVVIDGKYIYLIGDFCFSFGEMEVHRLDLSTKTWELLHKSNIIARETWPRHQSQPVFYQNRIYIFGNGRGDSIDNYCRFSEIHVFDVTTKTWVSFPAIQDSRVPIPGYPSNRSGNSCAQCPINPNFVFICGGYNINRSCIDVWRFDLDNLQWINLIWVKMSQPLYFHSTDVTPSGRMCFYGGIMYDEQGYRGGRSKDIISTWITIPRLKVICWEAMMYYFKDQILTSSDEQLKWIGLPQELYERIIEERRPYV